MQHQNWVGIIWAILHPGNPKRATVTIIDHAISWYIREFGKFRESVLWCSQGLHSCKIPRGLPQIAQYCRTD